MKGAPGAYERTNGNGHRREFERTEEDDWARSRPDPDNFREDDMSLDFLDVNLVSNLVRWAVQANRRIGHERLMDLLELYFRSGHCSRELKEIISYICATVEDAPEHESSPAQEYVDLIHQLHGILAGGMAIDTERLDGAERPFAGGV